MVPVIAEGSTDAPAMIGDNVMFSCTVTGIPIPTITWSSDRKYSIEATDDIIVDANIKVSTLTLSNLQVDDFDNYNCTATNMFGSDNITALLGSEYLVYFYRMHAIKFVFDFCDVLPYSLVVKQIHLLKVCKNKSEYI